MDNFLFNPQEGTTILEPEGKGKGYWIGASSIFFDKDFEKFYLYVRIRNPRPKKGKVLPSDTHRGYKCQILESINGTDFKVIWEMGKKEIDVKSIEGASMIKIQDKYNLFFSYESNAIIPRWQIKKIVARDPSNFDSKKIQKIKWNLPRFHRLSIKDPIVSVFNDKIHLYIDYFRFWKKPWGSSGLLTSQDGISFKWNGDVFVNLKDCKWASYMIRLTSIFEFNDQYFGFFDGTDQESGLCEEKSGVLTGSSPKNLKIQSLEEPTYHSDFGKGSCRYLFGLKYENELWVYYEFTEKNGEHVLKLIKLRNF